MSELNIDFPSIAKTQRRTFLGDGGEMGRLVRAFDWAASPLGSAEMWPQSLRVAVRLMLTSSHPMFIWWGPDLIQFYNDAYRETMGPERHPSALGGRGRDCWAEIWDVIGPQIDFVMCGEGSTWNEDHLVPVTRHGLRQDVWWTYGYSPIDLDDEVGGVLVVCNDVTAAHEQAAVGAKGISSRQAPLTSPSALDPEVLLTRIGEYRDKAAFASLFEIFAPKMKGYAMSRGWVDARAEKAALDAMVAAWHEAPDRRYDGTTPAAWLFRLLARQLAQGRALRPTQGVSVID